MNPFGFHPCGACRELVPVVEGCAHWQPGVSVRTAIRRMQKQRWQSATRARRKAGE